MPLTKSYYKWRKYYKKRYGKKKKSLYKKSRRLRKYQKGGRSTSTIIFQREASLDVKVSKSVDMSYFSIYGLLFGIEDFAYQKEQWDQFKLDWASFTVKYQCAKASNNSSPFVAYSLFDRTGLPQNEDITVKDILSYGTYKKSLSSTAGYATTSQFIVPTTMQEKGQWLSTDIQGVAGQNVIQINPTVIPRYRSIYFPWNPTVVTGVYLQNIKDDSRYDGIATISCKIAVTFRGKRQSTNGDDRNDLQMMAEGENEEPMINPPSGKIEIEEQKRFDSGIPYNKFETMNIKNTYLIDQIVEKNVTTSLPNFNTVSAYIGNLVTDLGKEVYNSWMNKIIAFCAGTLVSSIQNIASYGLRNVISLNPSSNDNNFIGLNGGTTYYFTDGMATNGIPDDPDSTTAVISDYITPFNAGNHLKNWWINAAKQFFMGNYTFNDVGSCSLYYKVESNSLGFIRSLLTQNTVANSMCQWNSINVSNTTTFTIPAWSCILIQFPHANYWITGVIYNNKYVGTGSNVTAYTINLKNEADVICLDGEKFINTDVSNIIYAGSGISLLTGYGLSFNAVNNTSTSATPIAENVVDCISLPLRNMIGNGMIDTNGPYASTESMGLIYPLYFSKNRLFI